jgi:TRAP-type mannitol/chloroaromatic compound transport system permease small subunit
MVRFINLVDSFTAWVGKAFAWCILMLTFAVAYEVFVRYAMRDPTSSRSIAMSGRRKSARGERG